jgi:hypothetical protein
MFVKSREPSVRHVRFTSLKQIGLIVDVTVRESDVLIYLSELPTPLPSPIPSAKNNCNEFTVVAVLPHTEPPKQYQGVVGVTGILQVLNKEQI